MNRIIGVRIDPRWLDERRGEGWSSGERIALWGGKACLRIEYVRGRRELQLLEDADNVVTLPATYSMIPR